MSNGGQLAPAGRWRFGRSGLVVNKITWQKVGHVTKPGRYMYTFGWLTIATEDLAVWEQFPNATFTLVKSTAVATADISEEFHLGAFELPSDSAISEK
jgi:hypothetical protein